MCVCQASPNAPPLAVSRRGCVPCVVSSPLFVCGGERPRSRTPTREDHLCTGRRCGVRPRVGRTRDARRPCRSTPSMVLSQPNARSAILPWTPQRRNGSSSSPVAEVEGGGVGSASATAAARRITATARPPASRLDVPTLPSPCSTTLGLATQTAIHCYDHIDAFAAAVILLLACAGAPNCRHRALPPAAPHTKVYDFERQAARCICTSARRRSRTKRAMRRATTGSGISRAAIGHPPCVWLRPHQRLLWPLPAPAQLFGRVKHGKPRDKPFFAYLALWEPHEPVHRWSPAAAAHYGDAPAHGRASRPRMRTAVQGPMAGKQKRLPALESGGGGGARGGSTSNPPLTTDACRMTSRLVRC